VEEGGDAKAKVQGSMFDVQCSRFKVQCARKEPGRNKNQKKSREFED
jgi:hypothetical protein